MRPCDATPVHNFGINNRFAHSLDEDQLISVNEYWYFSKLTTCPSAQVGNIWISLRAKSTGRSRISQMGEPTPEIGDESVVFAGKLV